MLSVPKVTRKELNELRVGTSRLYVEREGTNNPGSDCTMCAFRAGIKITTLKCFLIVPSKDKMIKCVLVTRISKEEVRP